MRLLFSEPPTAGIRAGIFFDRDGVINERIMGGYVTRWCQFQFVRGIQEALRELSQINLPIIVVSNQAAVGKGLLRRSTLTQITNRFVKALREAGARIDAVYYCPHTAEQGCECRKPREGLLREAAAEWRLDLSRSVLVGDSMSDVEAARAADCKIILFDRTGCKTRKSVAEAITVKRVFEIAGCVFQCLQVAGKVS